MNPTRLKLNWFSPLPPLNTGIGHYSARILPALSAVADVTLWTVQDKWDKALEQYAAVRRWKPSAIPWRVFNGADLSCYQIGNNAEFHGEITALARAMPGMVVLHDIRLQHLLKGALSPQRYRRLMFELYGQAGLEGADAIDRGQLPIEAAAIHFPLTPYATDRALGVLVHNQSMLEALHTRFDQPVFDLPLPYEAGPPPEPPQRSGAIRLVQFGYLGPNRRIDKVFEALAGMPEKSDFRLDIYGTIWDRPLLEKWIVERSLDKVVQLHGFVEEAVLNRAIADAELAVNLRWPTMGEASITQLRVWNAGRTALVTNIGWYAQLPADAAFFVDLDHEVEDIRRHLRALKADPTPYWRSGARGREILEHRHNPSSYVEELVSRVRAILAADTGVGRSVGMRLGNCLSQWPSDVTEALDLPDLAARLDPQRSPVCGP